MFPDSPTSTLVYRDSYCCNLLLHIISIYTQHMFDIVVECLFGRNDIPFFSTTQIL